MGTIGILHCSDMHLGRQVVRNHLHWFYPLTLANSHDAALCFALPDAMDLVAKLTGLSEDEEPRVLCSGDLTAKGREAEFVVGHTMLRSLWRGNRAPGTTAAFGLDCDLDAETGPLAVIPGNHDQWDGVSWPRSQGYNPFLSPAHFAPTPFKKSWIAKSGDLEVELFGLDSNSGMGPAANTTAGGRFDPNHLADLEARLQASDADGLPDGVKSRVRALAVHHTLIPRGHPKALDKADGDRLLHLAETYKINVILTGHVHSFLRTEHLSMPKRHRKVLELRCASTTQGPARRTPTPGLWAHKIYSIPNGAVFWDAWRCFWNGSGFSSTAQPDVHFAII